MASASGISEVDGDDHCYSPAAPPLLRPAPPHPHQCPCESQSLWLPGVCLLLRRLRHSRSCSSQSSAQDSTDHMPQCSEVKVFETDVRKIEQTAGAHLLPIGLQMRTFGTTASAAGCKQA